MYSGFTYKKLQKMWHGRTKSNLRIDWSQLQKYWIACMKAVSLFRTRATLVLKLFGKVPPLSREDKLVATTNIFQLVIAGGETQGNFDSESALLAMFAKQ